MSNWIEHKSSQNPFSFDVSVNLKCKHRDTDTIFEYYHRPSQNVIWDNSVRSFQIMYYQRSNPLEIGDTVKVVNETLDTHGSEGRIINIVDGLVSVKLDSNYVIHRNGRPTHIVRYRDSNLKLLKKQQDENEKSAVLMHLFGARENDFDKVCVSEFMQCDGIQDAREEAAKLIKRNKQCGIKYFWLTMTNMPRQVDIEERVPKLVKL